MQRGALSQHQRGPEWRKSCGCRLHSAESPWEELSRSSGVPTSLGKISPRSCHSSTAASRSSACRARCRRHRLIMTRFDEVGHRISNELVIDPATVVQTCAWRDLAVHSPLRPTRRAQPPSARKSCDEPDRRRCKAKPADIWRRQVVAHTRVAALPPDQRRRHSPEVEAVTGHRKPRWRTRAGIEGG